MYNISAKNNIRNLRKAKNITQEEMSLKMDISLTAYRDLERGKTAIINGHKSKIAQILDTTVEEILLGYQPGRTDSGILDDVRQEYGGQITILETRIDDLEKLVAYLEETVKTKNEIISMLKKSLDKQE